MLSSLCPDVRFVDARQLGKWDDADELPIAPAPALAHGAGLCSGIQHRLRVVGVPGDKVAVLDPHVFGNSVLVRTLGNVQFIHLGGLSTLAMAHCPQW